MSNRTNLCFHCRTAVPRILVLIAFLLISPTESISKEAAGSALRPAEEIVSAQRFEIHSEILNEDRSLLVYLPESYRTSESLKRRFPVIYLLDGPALFEATTGIVHHLSAPNAGVESIPEAIVVGIVNTKRRRDMTPSRMTSGPYAESSGGAASFRTFLEKELMPQVDVRFRTDKSAILIGHSLAGLFVLDTFVEQPQLFQGYIAIDPSLWWDSNLLARKLSSRKSPANSSRARVFIAQGNTPIEERDAEYTAHVAGIAAFREALGNLRDGALNSYEMFEHETHMSVPLVGIHAGLVAIYRDYKKR